MHSLVSHTGCTVLIRPHLSVSPDSAHEPPERDDLLHVDDVLEVLVGAVQRHLLNRLGRLAGVLEEDQVTRCSGHLRGLRGLAVQETRLTRMVDEVCGQGAA